MNGQEPAGFGPLTWSSWIVVLVVALICGMAMFQSHYDQECGATGGRVVFSVDHWHFSSCIRDGAGQ